MLKYLDFKEAKCKNCYKCLKNCPVKAIKIEDNQAKVIEDRCILCGNCTLICPQNAKNVREAGANILVAGSAIINAENYKEVVNKLKQ